MREYLRKFPKARIVNDWMWAYSFRAADQEVDFVCWICRESLNTINWRRTASPSMEQSFIAHGEQCAMLFLAGMIRGVGPKKVMDE
jgi:hypothetical protein